MPSEVTIILGRFYVLLGCLVNAMQAYGHLENQLEHRVRVTVKVRLLKLDRE